MITGTVGTGIAIGLVLLSYAIAPAAYRALSQQLFTVLYRYNAPPRGVLTYPSDSFASRDDTAVLRVLARPPQTPYDTLITTVADVAGNPDGKYVYNADGIPVGRVRRRHRSVYQVVLFSSPKSEEIYAIDDMVVTGVGSGNGSFVVRVPISRPVSIGAPIRHQKTGVTVSTVVLVTEARQENVQEVVGVLASNPLETADLFLFRGDPPIPLDRDVETAIQAEEAAVTQP